jgi:hypothetical protein
LIPSAKVGKHIQLKHVCILIEAQHYYYASVQEHDEVLIRLVARKKILTSDSATWCYDSIIKFCFSIEQRRQSNDGKCQKPAIVDEYKGHGNLKNRTSETSIVMNHANFKDWEAH